jgi:uncharacterized protein YecE (DUF72 family)
MTEAVIATAGWGIPRTAPERFAGEAHQLERYAQVLNGVEINSSFYRAHGFGTYAKWAAMTPPHFRFAVKLPKAITQGARLLKADALLDEFLEQVNGLGDRLGPLLMQLPPSLGFESDTVQRFFELLRTQHGGTIVCEPRHASWGEHAAEALMNEYRIGRVAADPCPFEQAGTPGGWTGGSGSKAEPGTVYLRLHGSPRRYWSAYTPDQLAARCAVWQQHPTAHRWCVFDNTASGAALTDAV